VQGSSISSSSLLLVCGGARGALARVSATTTGWVGGGGGRRGPRREQKKNGFPRFSASVWFSSVSGVYEPAGVYPSDGRRGRKRHGDRGEGRCRRRHVGPRAQLRAASAAAGLARACVCVRMRM